MSHLVAVLFLLALAGLNLTNALGALLPHIPLRSRINAATGIIGTVGLLAAAWGMK